MEATRNIKSNIVFLRLSLSDLYIRKVVVVAAAVVRVVGSSVIGEWGSK